MQYRCSRCGATTDTEATKSALREAYGPNANITIPPPSRCGNCGSTDIHAVQVSASSPPAWSRTYGYTTPAGKPVPHTSRSTTQKPGAFPWEKWFRKFLVGSGIILLIIGAFGIATEILIRNAGVTAEAEVVEARTRDDDGKRVYQVKYRFVPTRNDVEPVESLWESVPQSAYRRAEQSGRIAVVYVPLFPSMNRPAEAGDLLDTLGSPIVILCLGVVVTAGALAWAKPASARDTRKKMMSPAHRREATAHPDVKSDSRVTESSPSRAADEAPLPSGATLAAALREFIDYVTIVIGDKNQEDLLDKIEQAGPSAIPLIQSAIAAASSYGKSISSFENAGKLCETIGRIARGTPSAESAYWILEDYLTRDSNIYEYAKVRGGAVWGLRELGDVRAIDLLEGILGSQRFPDLRHEINYALKILRERAPRPKPGPFIFRNGKSAASPAELARLCLESPEDGWFHLEGGHFQPWLVDTGSSQLIGSMNSLPTSDQAYAVRVFAGRVLFSAVQSADEKVRLSALDTLWWAVDNEPSFRASICREVDDLESAFKADMAKLKIMYFAFFNNAVIDTLHKMFEDVPDDLGKTLCLREMPKYSLSLEGGHANLRRD